MTNLKIVVEKHPECYIAYPLGIEGVVVGQGGSYGVLTLLDRTSPGNTVLHIDGFIMRSFFSK